MKKSAFYRFVAVMGAWMGAAGIEHGVGEILQGDAVPEGLIFPSWPHAAFFESLSSEPAMTILPNIGLTGILAAAFSLLFAVWAIFFAHRKHGGRVLMLLAVLMLLFGGGIFPPILGLLIGAAVSAYRPRLNPEPAPRLRRFLGQSWGWILAACCAAWLALLPGVPALNYFWGVDSSALTLAVMASALLLLLLAYYSSLQHDCLVLEQPENSPGNRAPNQAKADAAA